MVCMYMVCVYMEYKYVKRICVHSTCYSPPAVFLNPCDPVTLLAL